MKKYKKYARLSIFSGLHVESLAFSCTDPKSVEEVGLELRCRKQR